MVLNQSVPVLEKSVGAHDGESVGAHDGDSAGAQGESGRGRAPPKG
eukprot:gene1954-6380_t